MSKQAETFVPAEALRPILSGSFEAKIGDVQHAIERNQDRIFEDGVRFWTVGTFEDRAIVASEDGRFLDLSFDGSDLVDSKPLEIPIYRGEDAEYFRIRDAMRAVRLFAEGNESAAMELLEAIAPHCPPLTDEQRVDRMVEAIKRPRPWRQAYEAKSSEFEAVAGEVDEAFEPGLTELLEHQNAGTDAETLLLVRQEVRKLAEGLDDLASSVNASVEGITEGTSRLEDGLGDALVSFGRDLADDLEGLGRLVEDATLGLSCPEQLSRLYDALALEFPAYQVAGGFLQGVADKLSE